MRWIMELWMLPVVTRESSQSACYVMLRNNAISLQTPSHPMYPSVFTALLHIAPLPARAPRNNTSRRCKCALSSKTFESWRKSVRYRVFCRTRKRVAAAAFVLKPAFAAGILSILDALGAVCHRSLLNLNCNTSRGAGKTAWSLDEFTNQQLQHLDKDMVPLLENAGVVARDALDHLRETLKDRLVEIQKRQALEAELESLGNGNTSIAAARHAREARTTEMRQMRSDLSRLPSYVILNDMA